MEANGTVLASDSALVLTKNAFVQDTVVFNSGPSPAQLGQALLIRLAGTGINQEVWFDKVTLDASSSVATPEPATLALVIVGLGLAVARRRSKVASSKNV